MNPNLLSGEKIRKSDLKKTEENIFPLIDDMRKKLFHLKVTLVFLFFLLLLFFLCFGIHQWHVHHPLPVLFDSSSVSIDYEQLNQLLQEKIMEQSEQEAIHSHAKSFVAMHHYFIDVFENQILVYSWVLESTYYEEDGKILQESGFSIPHKFVITKEGDTYFLENMFIPRDGESYQQDMKRLFPSQVLVEMKKVSQDGVLEDLQFQIQKQKECYYH